MALKELYNPESGRMRIAGLMSGSGSNLRKIIEHEKAVEELEGRAHYNVVVIFSDNINSNAETIGRDFEIPVVTIDLAAFYKRRGKPRRDLEIRAEFDRDVVEKLSPFYVDAAAYAGYMSIATPPLINAFLGVNVHPADLSLMDGDKRRYTGDHAVGDAIFAGEKQLRSTTHIIEKIVDYGRILMISPPVNINLPSNFDVRDREQLDSAAQYWQNRLKEVGDWVIFPRTLEYIASGRYSQDEQGILYFDDKKIPHGVRLEA